MELFATDIQKIEFLLETEAGIFGEDLRAAALTAEEVVSEELPPEKRPKYVTNYIGSKQKLVDWIWKSTPDEVKSVFDAFSGSAVVAYMYKTKGMKVVTNDRLKFSYHAARALIENNSTRLSADDIEKLVADNSGSKDFIQKTFKGLFFAPGVHKVIDQVRTNIDGLSGYKKDIALLALCRTCLGAKGGFGHFSAADNHKDRSYDSPAEFIERFKNLCNRINSLVFDNGHENKAHNQDIMELVPTVKVNLAYFDPPYATHFSTTNYEKSYHFLEGLVTYWKDKEIDKNTKVHSYKIDSTTVTQSNANEFFSEFLGKSKHIKYWLISYRDKAYPSESEMKKIIAKVGKSSRMKSKDHSYSITSKRGEASQAKEHLFICSPDKSAKADEEDSDDLHAEAMEGIGDISLDVEFDPDLLSSIAGKTDNIRVTGYLGNKHFIMNWIDKQVPRDIKSFFDAFSGGANVAYFYKRKGLQVFANDLLKYPYHLARAIIENNSVTLTDEDVEMLLSPNSQTKSFIADTFHGYYFTRPILEFLDNTYANIQHLSGYKKDLALAALGNTCKAKAIFGLFTRSKKGMKSSLTEQNRHKSEQRKERFGRTSLSNLPLSKFVSTFQYYLRQLNSLVYDNGRENKAYNGDVLEIISRVKADVIYCDPPYVTEFGTNDYEARYHFVEGLMTYWQGKEIQKNSLRDFPSRTKYNKESMAGMFEKMIGKARGHFPHILISYRDKAFPSQQEIADLLKGAYQNVKVKNVDVEYNIVRKDSKAGGKYAKELLFIASDPKRSQGQKSQADSREEAQMHTFLSIDIGMQTQADEGSQDSGDKRFSFILCHAGTNNNGDHFLVEELASRYQTAINQKINLKHSQDITDIVGGVVASDFVEDGSGPRVECVGELFTQDNDHARLAYKLMKKGIITQVSMECGYQSGECSVCGKKINNKANYCLHLKKYKGREFNGQVVYEILHGISFTGLGLLDRKGADENAKITAVSQLNNNQQGGNAMSEEKMDKDAAKKNQGGGGGDGGNNDQEKDSLIKQLEEENRKLKQQLADLQKQVEKYEAETQAAVRKSRAEKLLGKLEKNEVGFAAEEREKELARLSGLGDEAFTATEAAYDQMLASKKKEPDNEGKKDDHGPKAKADSNKKELRTDAGVAPHMVDDKKSNLEGKLTNGFMEAYKERVEQTA